MEPLAAVAAVGAICTAAGAAGALVARTGRMAIASLAVALVFAPLTMSPLPAALPAAFWLVAVLLAAYILVMAVREESAVVPTLAPMPLGGGAEALFVSLGLALGWAVAGIAGPDRGAPAALAAGIALGFAAGPLALFGRDPLHAGMAGVLAIGAGALLVAGLAGTPGTAEMTALAVAVLAAAAGAWGVMRLAPHPGRSAEDEPGAERRTRDAGERSRAERRTRRPGGDSE